MPTTTTDTWYRVIDRAIRAKEKEIKIDIYFATTRVLAKIIDPQDDEELNS